jgi:signal transduction histidine kinase
MLLNLDKLLNSVIPHIQQAFGFYGVTICLRDNTGQLIAHTAAGEHAHQRPVANLRFNIDSTSPIGEAAISRKIVYVSDLEKDTKYKSDGLRADGRSEVSIPLIIGSSGGQDERLVGVLDIHHKQANAFMPEDLSVLQILGREIAIAIRNAQLFDEIQKVNAAKTNFISYISHEVRNPITNILQATEAMLKFPEVYGAVALPTAYHKDIVNIESSANHLRKLMDDILDLSKIEAGKMEMSIRAVDPVPILRDVEQHISASLQIGVVLTRKYADQVPKIMADDLRLKQVLLNLLGNAAKFTTQGNITLDAQVKGNNLCFSVSDTGPGISPEAQSRLFQPFTQASTQIARNHGGTGLGLTISKQIVELQGGTLWLESQLERGTTFYFTIPLATG